MSCERRDLRIALGTAAAALSGDSAWGAAAGEQITPEVFLVRGPVNGVLPGHQGETLAIYGDSRQSPPATKWVLFTHHRRDVVWAGRELVLC